MSTLKPPSRKQDKLNPSTTRPPILPEQAIVGAQSLPGGFVNDTNDVNFSIPNTRCFTIEAAHALFAPPAIASFLRNHSAPHKRHTEAGRVELSNCYTCALATARDLVYMTGGGALAPHQHALWPGEPWAQAYPEFEKTTRGKFPAFPQHSARDYLDYASCLFIRSESFTPVGTAGRANGECVACKSTRAPRSFPLFYVIPPRYANDTRLQSIQMILLQSEICGAVPPRIQDPYRFLAPQNTGAICDGPIPSCPSVTDDSSRACQSEVLAICKERKSGTSEMHTKFASESRIQYAGFDCEFVSDVQHIGGDAASGHYVAIADTVPDSHTHIDEQVIARRVLQEEAWSAIESGPGILLYEKLTRVEAREEFPCAH